MRYSPDFSFRIIAFLKPAQTPCLTEVAIVDRGMFSTLMIPICKEALHAGLGSPSYILSSRLWSALSLSSSVSNASPVCFIDEETGPSIFSWGSVLCKVPVSGWTVSFLFDVGFFIPVHTLLYLILSKLRPQPTSAYWVCEFSVSNRRSGLIPIASSTLPPVSSHQLSWNRTHAAR